MEESISIVEFDMQKKSYKKMDFETAIISENRNLIYWVHCISPDAETLNRINHKIHLPENLIDLCLQQETLPQLIDTDETVTIQIQCLQTSAVNEKTELYGNLIFHLTTKFCFTCADSDLSAIDEFKKNYPQSLRFAKTACFILFLILDNVVNDFANHLFNFEIMIDYMENKVRAGNPNAYNDVMMIKNQVMRVRRFVVATREILMRISGRNIFVISEPCRTSLYNLFNQSQMVFHECDSIRDILNGLLDQIDNSLMQKMNEIMKVLTAFAAIFLPLTLITGIYGMNFLWIPELHWKYGYFWALFLILFCGGLLFYIFKRNKWF